MTRSTVASRGTTHADRGRDGEVQRFRRSAGRVLLDLVIGPIGALLFLAMAVALLGGAVTSFPVARVAGGLIFGFFGLVMASGALVAMRRGMGRTLLEVGPDGLWTPELGHLRWDGVAEIRLGTIRGPGASAGETTRYRHLGIVPLDARRRPGIAWRAGGQLAGGFVRFVGRADAGTRIGATGLAPFGVASWELERPVDEVVRAIERYHAVVDLEAGPRPALDAAMAVPALDAAMTVPAPSSPSAATPGGGRVAGSRVTFHRPLQPPARLIQVATSLALSAGLAWAALSLASSSAPAVFVAVIAGFAILGLAIGLRMASMTIAAYRGRRAETLAVGPDGIEAPELGCLPWDRVGAIATECDPVMYGAHERWRLVIVPALGARVRDRYVVAADDLDRPFDEVLTLIRAHHAVTEPY